MKILMAAPHANLMMGGGAGIQLLQTKKHLPDYGIEVDFFNPWVAYRPEDMDLVHIFNANMAMHDLAMRLSDRNMPFVISPIFFTSRGPGFIRFSRWIERAANSVYRGIWTNYGIVGSMCCLSERVLPNTSDEARLMEEGLNIPAEKIRIIPNGVEARFYEADPSLFVETYGIRDFILYVGQIGSLRKNLLSLIHALEKIDHPAVLIGNIFKNDYAAACLKAAEGNRNITIIDSLPHDSAMLASAYAASSVFVLPAFFETPGIAALEAALTGSKIVITKYGGTRDYFREEAVYVEPESISSIAAGIEAALAKNSTGALRERIYREYRWEIIAEKTAAAYREVMR